MTITLCLADIQEVRTQFVRNKLLSTSYASKQPISKLHCVEWCFRERQNGKCKTAGYNKYTKVCSLSMDYLHTLQNAADKANGVFLMDEGYTLTFLKSLFAIRYWDAKLKIDHTYNQNYILYSLQNLQTMLNAILYHATLSDLTECYFMHLTDKLIKTSHNRTWCCCHGVLFFMLILKYITNFISVLL